MIHGQKYLDPELGFASGKPIESIRVGDWVLTHSDEWGACG